eukprot:gene20034-23819_t
MGAAAAEVARQLGAHLGFAGVGIAVEQGLGGHDHAVEAVAALGGLFIDEGLLHRVRGLAGAEAFEGDDVAAHGTRQGEDAGTCSHAVDDHRAGAALPQAAAVFGAVELQVIAQDQQQRGVGHCADFAGVAVDLKRYRDVLAGHSLRPLDLVKCPLHQTVKKKRRVPGVSRHT